MLPPPAAALSLVQDPCDKINVLDPGLAVRYSLLQTQSPLGGAPHSQLLLLLRLSGRGQGVRAAGVGVGPQRGEGNLGVTSLLEQ